MRTLRTLWPGWAKACIRVFIVSTGYIATCSVMPATAPAAICCTCGTRVRHANFLFTGAVMVCGRRRPMNQARTPRKVRLSAGCESPLVEATCASATAGSRYHQLSAGVLTLPAAVAHRGLQLSPAVGIDELKLEHTLWSSPPVFTICTQSTSSQQLALISKQWRATFPCHKAPRAFTGMT